MTISRLLIVLATILVGISSAQDQPRKSENFALGTRKFDLPKLQPPTTYNFSLAKLGQRAATLNPDLAAPATCYTMRTYVADRNLDKEIVLKSEPEEVSYRPPVRNDPETPLTGNYTTCQPSSQFQVRTTVQRVEIAPDRK